jgi:hypothetical protein
MQQKQRRKVSLIVLGILACLGVMGIKEGLDYWEARALDRLTTCLGIESSWESFDSHLEHTFVVGMTLPEVLRAAQEIGRSVAVPKVAGDGITIVFEFTKMGFPPTVRRRYKWIDIYYDTEGVVTSVHRYPIDGFW